MLSKKRGRSPEPPQQNNEPAPRTGEPPKIVQFRLGGLHVDTTTASQPPAAQPPPAPRGDVVPTNRPW